MGEWAARLSRRWMEEDPQSAGTLYVDGHVRVYHGSAARLCPGTTCRGQRLCLRGHDRLLGSTGARGDRFFVVHRPVDPGLLKVLEEEIVPRLEREVPGQPSVAELAADPTQEKFIVVFDREGYSPEALRRLKERRIEARMTYHKHPGPDWPASGVRSAKRSNWPRTTRRNFNWPKRATVLSNGFTAREVRHLDGAGHQTLGLGHHRPV